jgi:hypothetical protein
VKGAAVSGTLSGGQWNLERIEMNSVRRRLHTRVAIGGFLACVALAGSRSSAQEAMNTAAATMPSPGTYVLRDQLHLFRYGEHPASLKESREVIEWSHSLAVGLDRGLALAIEAPINWKHDELDGSGSEHDRGLESVDIELKWRVYQDDSGGIDTLRAALLGGVRFDTADDNDWPTESVNPHLGAVVTKVYKRHGFNQDVMYTFNTGGDEKDNYGNEGPHDSLSFNTAYLYRIAPDRYTAETTGAWYVTAEINGLYETNADWELRFSPGLMYEGREFGFEIMGQLPLADDLDHRAELDVAIGVGVRLLF